MCRQEESRLLLETCVPYAGLGSRRMQVERGPHLGIRIKVWAGINTPGFPLRLTCLRCDARKPPTMTRKPKSRHLTPPGNRSK